MTASTSTLPTSRLALRLLAGLLFALAASLNGCACGPTPCTTDADCADGEGCLDDVCVAAGPALCARCVDNQSCDDQGTCLDACDPGFEWNGSSCDPEATGCDICVAENRTCTDENGPVCSDCIDGFFEDDANNCAPELNCDPAPAAGSIATQCEDENRACIDAAGQGADCGDCLDGYLDVEGACEAEQPCDTDLVETCALTNQTCIEDPIGRCGDCLPNFIDDTPDDDTVTCRAVLTCADLDCDGACNESTETADAFCAVACTGPNNRPGVEDADGFCVECGTCDGPGQDGPYLEALYAGNACVCRSAPGHYYDPSLSQTFPCDADGDGWVRKTAQFSVESSDPVLQAVTACDVREISAFELRSANGTTRTVTLEEPVKLFEERELDDQEGLDDDPFPAFGGRSLRADEVNGLTKACVGDGDADFNANGFVDVDEHHGLTVPPPPPGGLPSIHAPFIQFAYFISLARGWYADGTYVIEEKARDLSTPAEARVPFVRESDDDENDDNDYWRQCVVWTDPGKETAENLNLPLTTYDFAVHAEPGFEMTLHSQFKCLVVVDQPTTPTSDPHHIWQGDLDSARFTLNDCGADGTDALPESTPSPGGDPNPTVPSVSCTTRADGSGLDVANATWAIVNYADYANMGEYAGGCVNECAEFVDTCPGYNPDNPNATKCVGLPNDFGRLSCGCDFNYGGPECDFGCPDGMLSYAGQVVDAGVGNNYAVAPRSGYWVCAQPAATGSATVYENPPPPPVDGGTGDGGAVVDGYRWFGQVPAAVPTTAVTCETPDAGAGGEACGAGYALHPLVLD